MLIHEELTEAILGAAIEVHREMGPGLLEAIYEECLCRELTARGIPFERHVWLGVAYKGEPVGLGYRIDLLVDDKVVVELKVIEAIHTVQEALLINYMRLSGKRAGLLINFNVSRLMPGGVTRRVV